MAPVGNTVRRILQATFGVDVQHYNALTDPFLRLVHYLRVREVGLVLDVGANNGGFAKDLIRAGFGGEIVSFEPLPDAHTQLEKMARTSRACWRTAPALALGDTNGVASFNVAGNSVSSSLLGMTPLHVQAAPGSAIQHKIEVNVRRLDDVWEELGLRGPAFLKIDVQGAEKMVLDGAATSVAKYIVGVQVELSLRSLYENQPLASELDHQLCLSGFELYDIIPGFRNHHTLALHQYDGIYFRP